MGLHPRHDVPMVAARRQDQKNVDDRAHGSWPQVSLDILMRPSIWQSHIDGLWLLTSQCVAVTRTMRCFETLCPSPITLTGSTWSSMQRG